MPDEVNLSVYVNEVADQLTQRIEQQRKILLKVVDEKLTSGESVDYCPLVDCSPRQKYRAAVMDAVQVIEDTRRSFKSRQLEELRKRLSNLLADDAARKF